MARLHCALAALAVSSVAWAADLYVAPRGDDANPGTKARPFATLGHAVAQARESADGPVRVRLRAGTYYLAEPLVLGPEDSGLAVEAVAGAAVTVSGGRVVADWQVHGGELLRADLGTLDLPDLEFRELYYRGRRQPLARVPDLDPSRPRLGGFLYNAAVVEQGSNTKFRYRPGELDPARWAHPERAILVFHPSVNYENVWAPLNSTRPNGRCSLWR